VRVPIGGTDWVELKPVEELTRADRKAVNAHIIVEADPATGRILMQASRDDEMADALLTRICTDWSFLFHNPSVDPSSLDKLSLEQDTAIRAAIQPHIDAIKGVNAPAKDNEVPTPGSAS